MSSFMSNNLPTTEEQPSSPTSTFGVNPFYPNGRNHNNASAAPAFGYVTSNSTSAPASAPASAVGATAPSSSTTSAPVCYFGGRYVGGQAGYFNIKASNDGTVPASSFPYGSTEHSRQGSAPTIGKLSPSRYLTIKEEETSNECLVCEKVFDKIVPNGVCDSEDCQRKYNIDTCYECGTELITSEEYKNRDRDEDVCKACWDGTTSKDEVTTDETNEAECFDCQNCGTTLSSPNDARKCDVYDPSRCNGTFCVECVDGDYCEPCQRGYDSDYDSDHEEEKATVTSDTLHEFLHCSNKYRWETDEEAVISEREDGKTMHITWDGDDEKLEELMSFERHGGDVESGETKPKLNLRWLEEVRKMYNWVEGEELRLQSKVNSSGAMYCWREEKSLPHIIIEKSGFACVRFYNKYIWMGDEGEDEVSDYAKNVFFVRVDSVYNDRVSKDRKTRKEM
jgi:hypothetical protein